MYFPFRTESTEYLKSYLTRIYRILNILGENESVKNLWILGKNESVKILQILKQSNII